MLNKKGMTLIEVVIAIAILSIGATILYSGFATIAKMMIDSEAYTRNVNSQFSALNGKEENGTELKEEDASITIEVDDKKIKVDSTLITAKSEIDTVGTLQLKKINAPEAEHKNYIDSVIDDWYKFLINQSMLGSQVARKDYYLKLLQEKGMEDLLDTSYWGGFTNDGLNVAYYLECQDYTTYPLLEAEVVEACNKIYDKDHPNPSSSQEKNARLGDRQYYIHAYVANPSQLDALIRSKNGKVSKEEVSKYMIYYAASEPTNKNTYQWRTVLVYNEVEKAWYYRRFATGQNETGAYLALTPYQYKTTDDLYLEMQNPLIWAKIR